MRDFLADLYESGRTKDVFGEHWVGPNILPHGEWVKVALFEKESEDGQVAEVYAKALPATFYRIDVMEGKDSTGSTRHAYKVTFGTGTGELVANIAHAISEGMLSFRPEQS